MPRVDGGGLSFAVTGLVALPIVAAIAASCLVNPMAGLAGLLGGTGVSAALFRPRSNDDVVLRIQEGLVTLHMKAAKEPVASVRLDEIVDVTLDSAALERIERGTSAETALHAIQMRRTEVVRARPVLVRRDGEPIAVGTVPLPHLQATEWLGRIRSFLRKHDWVPDDERPPAPSRPA